MVATTDSVTVVALTSSTFILHRTDRLRSVGSDPSKSSVENIVLAVTKLHGCTTPT